MTLTVTLFQSELAWENKQANLDHFAKRMEQVSRSDLFVLPEMFSTGFSMRSSLLAETMDGQSVTWMQSKAAEKNTTICGSLIIQDGDQFFNRFVWAKVDGSLQFYDKKHLFRMSEEHQNYAPGKVRQIFQLKDFNICPQVCYDLRFPVFSRNTTDFQEDESSQPYDLLLYVANWPAARYTHWRALLQARAIENQAYVVGVNRIGIDGNNTSYRGDSCAINYQGEFLGDMAEIAGEETIELEKAPLETYRVAFPAWKDGDQFSLT